jgi:hypothetical protein
MRRTEESDNDTDDDDRQTRSLAGLAIILAIALVGLFLVQRLSSLSALQDCLMQGRTNCAPIEVPAQGN